MADGMVGAIVYDKHLCRQVLRIVQIERDTDTPDHTPDLPIVPFIVVLSVLSLGRV